MKQKVLLVDDEADTLRTYSDILSAEGYEVTAVATGEEALELIDGYQPDVILLDVMLPGKDGLQVAQLLSRRSDARHIPIVLITALSSLPTEPDQRSAKCIRSVVYKPCRPRTLIAVIEDAIRYRR